MMTGKKIEPIRMEIGMKNNKGFTLVELIVVILVLGVVSGITALSINLIGSSSARQCATQMDALISKSRVSSLSHTEKIYINLYMLDGKVVGDYYENGVRLSSKELSGRRVAVSCVVGGVVSNLGNSSNPLKLSFNHSTGALNPNTADGSYYCTEINVLGGSRLYTITIAPLTGHHSIG